MVSLPSDAEVIGRSLDEPEVFGLIYDRHAATVLRFLGSNLLLKHRRGEARRLRASARMAAPREAAEARASAAALDARLLFPRVADAIEALPDGEREALLLFAWEDLSYQSVAEALELPVGTVRSRLNRARARLSELFEPDGESRVRSR
jgi:RNA polymerase sigma factor (sigma-70 family)